MNDQQYHSTRLTLPWFNRLFGVQDSCLCMYDVAFKAYVMYVNVRHAVYLTDAVELCELADCFLQAPHFHDS